MKSAFQHSKVARKSLAGETGVWLCAMGLAVGLLLIIGLLGIIAVNGLRSFWPKPVAVFTLRAKSGADSHADPTVVGGMIHGSRRRMIPTPAGQLPEREWHVQLGNREIHGVSFRYVPSSEIADIAWPADVMVLERIEYGPAIGHAVELRLQDGSACGSADPAFDRTLFAVLEEVAKLRERLRHVEKTVIGRINLEIEKMRLQERAAPENESAAQRLAERREALQQEYEQWASEARQLRRQIESMGHLKLTLLSGETVHLPLGSLLHAHYPNRMRWRQKAVFFARGLWRFLAEEPREANTEGGIFPALFGTFVMTLLMSLAVMPFGVLAAIYLREYARHGFLLRLVRISVNNLAGVPSIVFGVFGLGFFVYTLGGSIDRLFYSSALPTPTFGTGGILWSSLTLALMTVPVVIVASEEALAAVPRTVRDGSLALGASKWQTIYRVVLPAAAPGIMTGLILAMARGAGEVAPLMLVGVVKLAPSLPLDGVPPYIHLERKFMHLGFHIYDLGFQSPDSDAARPMVFATTLFLILLVVVLNLGALMIRERLRRKYATGAF
jgi:phosphate transport system permease protein